jgi:hypothetical protein
MNVIRVSLTIGITLTPLPGSIQTKILSLIFHLSNIPTVTVSCCAATDIGWKNSKVFLSLFSEEDSDTRIPVARAVIGEGTLILISTGV